MGATGISPFESSHVKQLETLVSPHLFNLHKEKIMDGLWEDWNDRDFKVALHGINKVLEPNRPSRTEAIYILRQGVSYQIDLDKTYNGFMAVVNISISSDEQIPGNYSAGIAMSGILGDNYVALSPPKQDIMAIAGIADDSDDVKDKFLHENSVIELENTESAIDLGSLINTFVANKDSDDSNDNK